MSLVKFADFTGLGLEGLPYLAGEGEKDEWYRWRDEARPNQIQPDGDWDTWLIVTGRGWGKTRTAAECFREKIQEGHRRLAILGPTAGDIRDVMIEGESGLLSVFPPSERPNYEPSKRRITFKNGAIANIRSGDEQVRGLQFTFMWADEYCAWANPDAWKVLQFGNRLKYPKPQAIVTTTPVPGHEGLLSILKHPKTIVTRGSMLDNKDNLSEDRVRQLIEDYGGTQLGRQELEGEILEFNRNALWDHEWFARDGFRLPPAFGVDEDGKAVFVPPTGLTSIAIALDPSVSDPERRKDKLKEPDACGIVVVGRFADGRGVILGDFTGVMSPGDWARRAAALYRLCKANFIVAEGNQGGELIREVIRNIDASIPIQIVHATIGKRPRAEPIALCYEQNRVSHCGRLDGLENEYTKWDSQNPAAKSPNRLDAAVWGLFALGLGVPTTKQSSRIKQQTGV